MRRAGLIAVLALGVLAPAPAHATRTQVSDEPAAVGPRLSTEGVVYQRVSGSEYQVRAASPGVAPRTLRSAPIPARNDDECCVTLTSFVWAVSGSRLATLNTREDFAKGAPAGASARLASGPLDGTDTDVFACGTGGPLTVGSFDLDGDRVAYVGGTCPGQPRGVVIRNVATGTDERTVEPPAGAARLGLVKLRGRYLAIAYATAPGTATAATEVVVRDLGTGTDVITARATRGFDLQPDGKLVTVTDTPGPDGCPDSAGWHSPAEPARHVLPLCPASVPRIGGDRLLVIVRPPGSGAALVLSDLAGNARPLLTADVPGGILPNFDVEAGRAAYGAISCRPDRSAVYLDDLAAQDPLRVEVDCPVIAAGGRIRASRSGAVGVRLVCPNGCGGTVALGRPRTDEAYAPARAFAGGPGTVRVNLKLRRSALRTLRRRGRLGARIAGQSGDPHNSSPKAFARTVTLLAPRR